MFRLILSIFLVVAVSGAFAASAMHSFNHGMDHAGHHGGMAEGDLPADAEKSLADCCNSTGGIGSASCFGDLVTAVGFSPMAPAETIFSGVAHASSDLLGLTLAVPTGPPKV